MLNYLWAFMVLVGIIWAGFHGNLNLVTEGALDAAKEAVALCITMLGVMSFWTGILEIGEKAGLIERLSNAMEPLFRFLFPRIPKDHQMCIRDSPKFIVCDEPVSALEVSIQAQILNLLQDLQRSEKLTFMFVTHDMSVVRHLSDDICVMYLGQVMEISPSKEMFITPLHPYTKALLSAIPSTDIDNQQQRITMEGEITSPIEPRPVCRFAARCPYRKESCMRPQTLEELRPGHFVACSRAREINGI